jgi:hypothetical protein
MGVYRIERNLAGATPADVDAAAFRAVACMHDVLGVEWVRSYFDEQSGTMTCFYRANSPADIRRHAELARIPCDAIDEVIEYLPDAYR